MSNDAFLGTCKDAIPFEDGLWCNPVEISSKAQTVLDTISADLSVDWPITTSASQYDKQQLKAETYESLKKLIPELQSQYVSGLLTKTQWEYDNGYPVEHVSSFNDLNAFVFTRRPIERANVTAF
jgi:hypothetical protein